MKRTLFKVIQLTSLAHHRPSFQRSAGADIGVRADYKENVRVFVTSLPHLKTQTKNADLLPSH